ncbi:PAAR domain-containing protein [Pseudomonas sp. SAR267]|uniref:PAAR domain-containing protein n=1 Tax=unclassified Pseudomonas TaxID=196821 RepID=UPI0028ADB844|nr:PAAR domain-containing protein [Pseudomonas sp.]
MRGVIRVGDKLSSGGKVIAGTSGLKFMQLDVACVGDAVFCPIPGHGVNEIAEGDTGSKVKGRPIALDGHCCSCGCELITSLPQAGRL